jgi:ornithine decarboxylase
MLTDVSLAQRNVRLLNENLPAAEVYYAVKANSDPRIIKAIDGIVAGYDVASWGEIEHLLGLGIAADRILYSNPVKIPEHIRLAGAAGVSWFAFDSRTEIEKLALHAPGSNVYLRLKAVGGGCCFPLSGKFGAPRETALEYCLAARDAGLNVRGATFHVGSQSNSAEGWEASIKNACEVLTELRANGITADFLDIGGGFPAGYTEECLAISAVNEAIRRAHEIHLPTGVRVALEPGRFVAADTGVLVCSVIGREKRGDDHWLYLDMGAFQGLIEPLQLSGWRYPVTTDVSEDRSIGLETYILSGPTCDPSDSLGHSYQLPADIRVGDRLAIDKTGAYSTVYASSNFNGFKPPVVWYT